MRRSIISKTDSRKDTRKFLAALSIYIVAIIFTDIMITDKAIAPDASTINSQGQNHQLQGERIPIPVYHRPDREPVEPSRGEAVRGRELTVESTSYSHTGSKTFSNTWPQEGRTIAVDNRKIKVGSRVYIQELGGWFIAEDLIPPSSVKKGAIIDIFREDEKSCWKWGRRDVRVRVIPPPGEVTMGK